MLKDEFWCILYTKFDTFVIRLVREALQKNVGILSGGNPPTPLPNYLFYRPLLIWTNVSNVSESQNVSVSSRKPRRLVSVSSRPKFSMSWSRLGLGHLGLVSRLGLGVKGLVDIPGCLFEFVVLVRSVFR